MDMSVGGMVSAALQMRNQATGSQASYAVAKLALDQMEQQGQDIVEMLGSLDPNVGGRVNISA